MSSMKLTEAIFALSNHSDSRYTQAERLQAIETLRDAPPEDQWNRGLILSLKHQDRSVCRAGQQACIARLCNLAENPEYGDAWLDALLDFCFLEQERDPQIETAREIIFQKITDFLLNHTHDYDHLRARVLARTPDMVNLPGQQGFKDTVVRMQEELAKEQDGQRSDAQVVARLNHHRKLGVYLKHGSEEATLQTYLNADRNLSIEDQALDRALLEAYATLIATQDHARQAVISAFENLAYWLSQLPQTLEQRLQWMADMTRARRPVQQWNELPHPIYLHLIAHSTLLPGHDEPNDIFAVLQKRGMDAKVLQAGFKTLRYLPGIRSRIPELCDYIEKICLDDVEAWQELFNLLEAIINGLPQVILDNNDIMDEESIDNEARKRERRRRNLYRSKALENDVRLRSLLYKLSHSDKHAVEIRQRAWRVLLRTLPEDRDGYEQNHDQKERAYMELFAEGLASTGNELFLPTLKVAGETYQRQIWELLFRSWQHLVDDYLPSSERQKMLKEVCDVLGTLGTYGAVSRLIALTLDDPDTEVRRYALDAIYKAGYVKELEREKQRRTLQELRERLTTIFAEINQLEQRSGELGIEITSCHTERTTLTLNIATEMQRRNMIVTDHMIALSQIEIDLREVQNQLRDALTSASAHEKELTELARQIQGIVDQIQKQNYHAEALLGQQRESEQNIQDNERDRERVEQNIRDIEYRLAHPPNPPRITSGNPADARRQQESYEEQVNRTQRQLKKQREDARQNLKTCEQNIKEAEKTIQRLNREIENVHKRAIELERLASPVRERFDREQSVLQALRAQIRELSERENTLQKRRQEQHQQHQAELAGNQREIDTYQEKLSQVQQRIAALSDKLNRTRDRLDKCRTDAQQTTQDINLGRQHYDRLTNEAAKENAQTDNWHTTRQEEREQKIRETQESLLWYAYDISQAVENQHTQNQHQDQDEHYQAQPPQRVQAGREQ